MPAPYRRKSRILNSETDAVVAKVGRIVGIGLLGDIVGILDRALLLHVLDAEENDRQDQRRSKGDEDMLLQGQGIGDYRYYGQVYSHHGEVRVHLQ